MSERDVPVVLQTVVPLFYLHKMLSILNKVFTTILVYQTKFQ